MPDSKLQTTNLNIALAHDSFTQMGGAERVVKVLHELYPTAPIFTLVLDSKLKSYYKDWDIRTSWLQVIYNFIPKLQYLLPFIPLATSSLDFSGYDVVISSSSSFIKNIYFPKNSLHINYCHTPTRFLWSDLNYVNQEVPGILKSLARFFLKWLKKWDFSGAQKVSYFIANSQEVKKRIKQYYKKDSTVIYPFVDSIFWQPTVPKSNYFLIVGRLQAHKRNGLIIEIFNELGLPLRVVGTGREEKHLKSMARQNIKFLGKVADAQLRDEYSGAQALIYPQEEDFGLVPLEAAACGTPSLAYAKGGALETVVPGQTGEFFYSYDKEDIKRLLLSWDLQKYSQNKLISQAQKFNKEIFKQNILDFIISKVPANEHRH